MQAFDDPATPQNEFRYKGWWGVDTLPEFADNEAGDDLHPGPKQYVFDSTKRWMDPNGDGDPRDGIDGWRLDVANEVPTGFWRDWHARRAKDQSGLLHGGRDLGRRPPISWRRAVSRPR